MKLISNSIVTVTKEILFYGKAVQCFWQAPNNYLAGAQVKSLSQHNDELLLVMEMIYDHVLYNAMHILHK